MELEPLDCVCRLLHYEVAHRWAKLLPAPPDPAAVLAGTTVAIWVFDPALRGSVCCGLSRPDGIGLSAALREHRGARTPIHLDGRAGHLDLVLETLAPLFVPVMAASTRTRGLVEDVALGLGDSVFIAALGTSGQRAQAAAYVGIAPWLTTLISRSPKPLRKALLDALSFAVGVVARAAQDAVRSLEPRWPFDVGTESGAVGHPNTSAEPEAVLRAIAKRLVRPVPQGGTVGVTAVRYFAPIEGSRVRYSPPFVVESALAADYVRLLQRNLFDAASSQTASSVAVLVRRILDEGGVDRRRVEFQPPSPLDARPPSTTHGGLALHASATAYVRVPLFDSDGGPRAVLSMSLPAHTRPEDKLLFPLRQIGDELTGLGDALRLIDQEATHGVGSAAINIGHDLVARVLHAVAVSDIDAQDALTSLRTSPAELGGLAWPGMSKDFRQRLAIHLRPVPEVVERLRRLVHSAGAFLVAGWAPGGRFRVRSILSGGGPVDDISVFRTPATTFRRLVPCEDEADLGVRAFLRRRDCAPLAIAVERLANRIGTAGGEIVVPIGTEVGGCLPGRDDAPSTSEYSVLRLPDGTLHLFGLVEQGASRFGYRSFGLLQSADGVELATVLSTLGPKPLKGQIADLVGAALDGGRPRARGHEHVVTRWRRADASEFELVDALPVGTGRLAKHTAQAHEQAGPESTTLEMGPQHQLPTHPLHVDLKHVRWRGRVTPLFRWLHCAMTEASVQDLAPGRPKRIEADRMFSGLPSEVGLALDELDAEDFAALIRPYVLVLAEVVFGYRRPRASGLLGGVVLEAGAEALGPESIMPAAFLRPLTRNDGSPGGLLVCFSSRGRTPRRLDAGARCFGHDAPERRWVEAVVGAIATETRAPRDPIGASRTQTSARLSSEAPTVAGSRTTEAPQPACPGSIISLHAHQVELFGREVALGPNERVLLRALAERAMDPHNAWCSVGELPEAIQEYCKKWVHTLRKRLGEALAKQPSDRLKLLIAACDEVRERAPRGPGDPPPDALEAAKELFGNKRSEIQGETCYRLYLPSEAIWLD